MYADLNPRNIAMRQLTIAGFSAAISLASAAATTNGKVSNPLLCARLARSYWAKHEALTEDRTFD